ncbi:MAG: hypothetical protein U5K54_26340 [Cytophagales bacterium]|nr:hypothetical protein [Cytophagales bacterium]
MQFPKIITAMPPITRGKVTTVAKAKNDIAKYVAGTTTSGTTRSTGRGHLFNFSLLKQFTDSISELIAQGESITGVRIYHSKSDRDGQLSKNENDLVLVPVMDNDQDYYNVYKKGTMSITPVLISNSTPCRNICNGTNLICP